MPVDGTARRGPQADRHRDGLFVVEEQRRQRCADTQAIAAGDAGPCVHRIAQVTQAGDVLANRSSGHREPLGELRAGPVAPALEQPEQAQQSRRRLQHVVDPGDE